MSAASLPSAEHFDRWYVDMAASPVRDELVRRHLGLPAHMLSTSALIWEAIAEVGAALGASADPALSALRDEGARVLENGHLSRRVMATATAQ